MINRCQSKRAQQAFIRSAGGQSQKIFIRTFQCEGRSVIAVSRRSSLFSRAKSNIISSESLVILLSFMLRDASILRLARQSGTVVKWLASRFKKVKCESEPNSTGRSNRRLSARWSHCSEDRPPIVDGNDDRLFCRTLNFSSWDRQPISSGRLSNCMSTNQSCVNDVSRPIAVGSMTENVKPKSNAHSLFTYLKDNVHSLQVGCHLYRIVKQTSNSCKHVSCYYTWNEQLKLHYMHSWILNLS